MHLYSFYQFLIIIIIAGITSIAPAGDTVTTPVAVFGFGELSSNAAFSPDGKKFVTRGSDQRAFLWDIDEGRVIATFDTISPYDTNRCIAISPDGTKLLTGGGYKDSIARIWDIASGTCLHTLVGHARVSCVTFTPDGKTALTGAFGETRLWDVSSGTCLKILKTSVSERHGAVFSHDGSMMLTANNNISSVWNTANDSVIANFSYPAIFYHITGTDFSPDGTKIIAGSDEDSMVYLCNVSSGDKLSFSTHPDGVSWVEFTPDGTKFLTASVDSTAKLWDIASGVCLQTFTGHAAPLISANCSPDGKTVLTASQDNMVKLWDISTGKCIKTFAGHTSDIRSVAFSPDGTQLLMAVDPNYAYIWDVATVTCRLVLADHQFWVYSVAWSPDGSMVATGSHDYHVRVWDAATGSCLKTYKMESSSHVLSLAWSPDGTKLLAGLRDWGAELWDITTDSFVREFNGKTDAKFSPDGNYVVTGPASGVDDAMVWDAATGKKIAVFKTDGATCHKTAFMPDGKTIATASSSTVEVWDISTGKCLKKVEDLAYEINAFTVAPDGRSFFIDHADNTVKMWSLTDSTCIKTFKGHLQRVKGVAISPNGQSVITASEDRTARLWDLGNNRIATRPPTTSRKIPHAIYKVIPIGNSSLKITNNKNAHQSNIQIFKPNGSTAVNLPVKSDRAVSLPTPLVPGVYLYRVNDPAGGITAFSGKFIIR